MTLVEILNKRPELNQKIDEAKKIVSDLKKEAKALEKELKKIAETEFDGDLQFLNTHNGKTSLFEVTKFDVNIRDIDTAGKLDKKRMLNRLKSDPKEDAVVTRTLRKKMGTWVLRA